MSVDTGDITAHLVVSVSLSFLLLMLRKVLMVVPLIQELKYKLKASET